MKGRLQDCMSGKIKEPSGLNSMCLVARIRMDPRVATY